jgi:hypothetical protein
LRRGVVGARRAHRARYLWFSLVFDTGVLAGWRARASRRTGTGSDGTSPRAPDRVDVRGSTDARHREDHVGQ